jgi:hypothetical protein
MFVNNMVLKRRQIYQKNSTVAKDTCNFPGYVTEKMFLKLLQVFGPLLAEHVTYID